MAGSRDDSDIERIRAGEAWVVETGDAFVLCGRELSGAGIVVAIIPGAGRCTLPAAS